MIEEDLPEDSAALIIHADGRIEAFIPRQDDEEYVPQNAMLLSAFMRIASDHDLMERTLNEFRSFARGAEPTLN